jgi:hypothetical protein
MSVVATTSLAGTSNGQPGAPPEESLGWRWFDRVGEVGLRHAARRGFHDSLTKKSNYWRFACTEFVRRLAATLPHGITLVDLGCGTGRIGICLRRNATLPST